MAAPKARSGLGRGLGDLIRPTSEPERHASDPGGGSVTDTVPGPQGSYFADVPVHEVRPNPRQPRQAFDEDEMSELVASIVEVGLLQPVVVRPIDPP